MNDSTVAQQLPQPDTGVASAFPGEAAKSVPVIWSEERPGTTRWIIAVVLAVVLLVGSSGAFVAAKAGVFGCQFASSQLTLRASAPAIIVGACAPSGSAQPGTSTTVASQVQPTATVPAAATVTAQSTATAQSTVARQAQPTATVPAVPVATAQPTATPVLPTPTTPAPPAPVISIVEPANKTVFTTQNGTDPVSGPITFAASVSPGGAAKSVTVTWSDNLDGTLGTGVKFAYTKGLTSINNTNCGADTVHIVTATAHNDLGGTASASIAVIVRPFCKS
jgi:hypothetical protein